MSYLSKKQTRKLSMRSGLSLVSLVLLAWLSIPPAQGAWDWGYALPINATNYPRAPDGASKYSVNTAYEVTQPVQQGQTLRFKVLIPPGVSSAKISAQSNSWQCAPDITDAAGNIIVPKSERCPIMDGFDHDQGEFCSHNPTAVNPSPCGGSTYIYPQDLHTVTARLLDILYPTESDSPNVVTQSRYAYFVLYQQPQALDKFAFTSNLGISFGISNVGLYNQWIDRGSPVPSNDNILTIAAATNNGTVTSNPSGISCGHGGTLCSASYTTGSRVTLTATAADGFAFASWGGHCAGATNPVTLIMDAEKTCTATFDAQTFPEIEVLFEGRTLLGDGSSTPIEFGVTPVGRPITKTFTVKNTGADALRLTNMTLSSGFSLVAGNLPNSIQVNSSADFTIQLDATTEGSYSSTLNILNNDPDEDSFNVVIAGTVTSNQDLNTGSLIGNLTLGSHNLYAGNAKITIFVGVEDSFDFFEPLTLDDWPWVIEQGSLVDINAIITPEPNHEPVDIVVVAALDGHEETKWERAFSDFAWYQKTPSQNLLTDTGWKSWSPTLNQPYIEPYGVHSGKENYSVNVFTGKLPVEIPGFGPVKRVHFFVGYGLLVVTNPSNPSEGEYSYLVSQPVTLEMSSVQLTSDEF